MGNQHLDEYEIKVLQIEMGRVLCKIDYNLHLLNLQVVLSMQDLNYL